LLGFGQHLSERIFAQANARRNPLRLEARVLSLVAARRQR